jgi:hypothetical protein
LSKISEWGSAHEIMADRKLISMSMTKEDVYEII